MAKQQLSRKAVKIHRQSIVRSLMARGLEQHEILATLEQPKYAEMEIYRDGQLVPNPNFVGNPKTGYPVSKATISRDWNQIQDEWRERALSDIDGHFARQLHEIQELKRAAWAAKDLGEVRQVIALEMKLLGTARPEKQEHRWDEEQIGKVDRLKDLFQTMRGREAERDGRG